MEEIDPMNAMLIDVRRAAFQGIVTKSYGPMEVFIMGFEATIPHPNRFIYSGCTAQVSNGRLCSKTVVGVYRCKLHNSLKDRTWKKTYRFDTFLADGSLGRRCPPLRASVFDAAEELIGLPTVDFEQKTPDAQDRLISNIVKKNPLVVVSLYVKNGVVTIGQMNPDPDVAPPLLAFTRATPQNKKSAVKSEEVFKTPKSTFSLKAASRGE
ncbi:unnamed protein product [Calypogeia fissa]